VPHNARSATSAQRFQGWSGRYAAFRPTYPEPLLRTLSHLIVEEPFLSGGFVADVGSGTGIFTRQLRALLPDTIPIVGIEPASDMRQTANGTSPPQSGVLYIGGTAEKLPLANGSVRAVVAATAAHWFDRPLFYREAHRSLMPSGLMAIVEYVRDTGASPAAAAVVDFLAQHGGPRAYAPPSYEAEVREVSGFEDFQYAVDNVTFQLTRDAFLGLAFSSSHARRAIELLGRERAENILLEMVRDLIAGDGCIPYGYSFRMFSVRRRESRRAPIAYCAGRDRR
jgi:SAM-dependent methyltransferase